jgi:hypothetical protein
MGGCEDEDVDCIEDGEVFSPEGDGLEGVDVDGEGGAGVEDGDVVWVVGYSVFVEGYYLKLGSVFGREEEVGEEEVGNRKWGKRK